MPGRRPADAARGQVPARRGRGRRVTRPGRRAARWPGAGPPGSPGGAGRSRRSGSRAPAGGTGPGACPAAQPGISTAWRGDVRPSATSTPHASRLTITPVTRPALAQIRSATFRWPGSSRTSTLSPGSRAVGSARRPFQTSVAGGRTSRCSPSASVRIRICGLASSTVPVMTGSGAVLSWPVPCCRLSRRGARGPAGRRGVHRGAQRRPAGQAPGGSWPAATDAAL